MLVELPYIDSIGEPSNIVINTEKILLFYAEADDRTTVCLPGITIVVNNSYEDLKEIFNV